MNLSLEPLYDFPLELELIFCMFLIANLSWLKKQAGKQPNSEGKTLIRLRRY